MKPGFPAQILLEHWAERVADVFDATVYGVGSCTQGKGWRDVDVVVMLDDAEFDRWFGPRGDAHGAPIWEAICLSFSLWGREATGLPIDFKVQRVEVANMRHAGKARSALATSYGKRLPPILDPMYGIKPAEPEEVGE